MEKAWTISHQLRDTPSRVREPDSIARPNPAAIASTMGIAIILFDILSENLNYEVHRVHIVMKMKHISESAENSPDKA